MQYFDHVERFLRSLCPPHGETKDTGPSDGPWPFVTISRQGGAGGHTLAQAIMDQLRGQQPKELCDGWQMLDQELCVKLSRESSVSVWLPSLLAEQYRTPVEEMIHQLVVPETPQALVVNKTFRLIHNVASYGKAVIVGRAGACVTASMPYGIHIRLVASWESRVQRVMGALQRPRRHVEDMMRRHDRDRARLVQDYFHRDINDPMLYGAVFNTDIAPIESVADYVVRRIHEKVLQLPQAPAAHSMT